MDAKERHKIAERGERVLLKIIVDRVRAAVDHPELSDADRLSEIRKALASIQSD